MDKELIAGHNFNQEKDQIKQFSETANQAISLEQVKESTLCLFKHRVTGEELNANIGIIQEYLKSQNQTLIQIIKKFSHVYGALEALDQDYISDILFTIDEIKKTSENLGVEQQNRIDEITLNNTKTLAVLREFKKKLDGYSHLKDIDKIWHNCQVVSKDINALADSFHKQVSQVAEKSNGLQKAIREIDKDISRISETADQLKTEIQKTVEFVEALQNIKHLHDIDEMWIDLANIHESIQGIAPRIMALENKYAQQEQCLDKLQAFMKSLIKIEHLGEVDSLWNDSNSIKSNISELFAKDESFAKDVVNRQQASNQLADVIESQAGELESLHKQTQLLENLNQANEAAIQDLNSYKMSLGEKAHLDDIDDTWNAVQNHTEQLKNLNTLNQTTRNDLEQALAKVTEDTNTTIQNLMKKLKYAYILAGGAIGLAMIELLMLL